MQDPSAKQIGAASSIHVLAFASNGELLVVESEGVFSVDVWEDVVNQASKICQGAEVDGGNSDDAIMDTGRPKSLEDAMRNVVHEKVAKEQKWKESMD